MCSLLPQKTALAFAFVVGTKTLIQVMATKIPCPHKSRMMWGYNGDLSTSHSCFVLN